MKHLLIIICLLLYQIASAQNANTKSEEISPTTIHIDKYFKIEENKDTTIVYRISNKFGKKLIYADFLGIGLFNGNPIDIGFGSNKLSCKELMYGLKEALKDLTQEYSFDKNYYQMWIDPLNFGYVAVDIGIEYDRLHPKNKKYDDTLLRNLYESKLINAIKDTLLLYGLELYNFAFEKVLKLPRNTYYNVYHKKDNKRKIPSVIICPGNILLQIRQMKN